ncbi:GNAT family N-acetyltransferase [Nocardia stercoris]|uniref:GNAT family N-acetyltransferase n=1 Tax=Nocardia stercoris TaxID=2483361 RepID=A0A3M2L669_9NOCA|nr:GNAT family N-acetyltransferase [Nocardia stercoris]RMI30058.1 GNAT family N-acetyltransferase [Nocardia stercoris]
MNHPSITVDRAGLWDAEALGDVAAATFPLAVPPQISEAAVAAHIDEALSDSHFADYLSRPGYTIFKAVSGGDIVGYTLLIDRLPADPEVARVITPRPALEVNRMYVLPGHHGTGVSTALMAAAVTTAREAGFATLWLGVNQENERARRFYAKHGFHTVGTRSFTVGGELCRDDVMLARL